LASVNTTELQRLDERHHVHPFTVHRDLWKAGVRVIERGEGIYLTDSDGNRIIDGMAGLWCVQVGYGRKELAQAAYDAISTLSYYNTHFQTTNPYAARLAHKLSEKTPTGLDHIFFANSGSEANDTAMKLIWFYWNQKRRPSKRAIISRMRAYHGSTVAAASLSGLEHMQVPFNLPIAGIHHIEPAPCYYEYGMGVTEEAFAERCADALERKILELGPENVAAFVGEPVMGAGGMMTPPKSYWQRVEAVCRKYDVLLWADEVICGFGRVGPWFGCQAYGFTPDVISMAKGMSSGYQPISAVALNAEIAGAITEADPILAHGYTYSGHPVACAVALRNIALIEDLDLVGPPGAATAKHFQGALAALRDHPIVGEVRGIGMLGAIEIVADKSARSRFPGAGNAGTIAKGHCIRNGAMIRSIRDTLVLAPPLVISPREIDDLVGIARKGLDLTAAELAAG
jgi:putrescine aminotransferase